MSIKPVNKHQFIPPCRGKISQNRLLSELTWLRVGGPADWLFQPADIDDLTDFMNSLDQDIPLFVIGVGSNLIVRDGGIEGVVIRLGRPFAKIEVKGCQIRVGAATLDSQVAQLAADKGLDLTFLRTIPGTIGGAVRMNAGCYGSYIKDVCKELTVIDRTGQMITIAGEKAGFSYRHSKIPPDAVIVEAVFDCPPGSPKELKARMKLQIASRDQAQPTKSRSAGSTFRNPAGFSSTGKPDDTHELKAWKLIDNAGLRGFRRGGAAVSEQHPNFLINVGGAKATEIEQLGEDIQKKVFQHSGIMLKWEIIRVGRESWEQRPL